MHYIEIQTNGFEFASDTMQRIREHIDVLCKNSVQIKIINISRVKTRRFSDINNFFYRIQVINYDHSSLTLDFEYHDIFFCLELAISRAGENSQQSINQKKAYATAISNKPSAI